MVIRALLGFNMLYPIFPRHNSHRVEIDLPIFSQASLPRCVDQLIFLSDSDLENRVPETLNVKQAPFPAFSTQGRSATV